MTFYDVNIQVSIEKRNANGCFIWLFHMVVSSLFPRCFLGASRLKGNKVETTIENGCFIQCVYTLIPYLTCNSSFIYCFYNNLSYCKNIVYPQTYSKSTDLITNKITGTTFILFQQFLKQNKKTLFVNLSAYLHRFDFFKNINRKLIENSLISNSRF